MDPKTVSKQFRWRTHDGRQHTLPQMVDRHLVYAMRMIYNNFLSDFGLDPVPGGKQWDLSGRTSEEWLRSIVAFMWEIESHRQFIGEYKRLYETMKLRLLEAAGIELQWIKEIEQHKADRLALPGPAKE